MRVGFLTTADKARVDWAAENGFGSVEWVGFENSPAGPKGDGGIGFARDFFDYAKDKGIRVSCIGAFYGNALDPQQSDFARSTFVAAIETASALGIKTVAGFPGAPIEITTSAWGGNPIYTEFDELYPRWQEFWAPIAKSARDKGVRLAFEHCATGSFHMPVMNFNILARPAMWERVFSESWAENIGIEWDASHLICQFIDPVTNIHKFGSRIFHVHAKDAFINRHLLALYGPCHHGVAEHRFPGLGETNWAEIVHALLRAGYDSDLNIEGWHDPVYRDHDNQQPADVKSHGLDHQAGQKLEEAGLIVARKTLEVYTHGTE